MYKFYESIPFGVLILKKETFEVEYLNNKFSNIFNISNNIIGKKLSNLYLPNAIMDAICYCNCNNKDCNLRDIEINSSTFIDITISVKENTLEVFINEIHENSKNNKDIIDNYIINTKLLEAFPYFICATDKEGNIKYMNKKAHESLAKAGIEDLKNLFHFVEVYNLYNDYGELLRIKEIPLYVTLNQGSCIMNKVLLCNMNQENFYIEMTTLPILNKDSIIGSICILKDITESYANILKEKKEREKFLALSTELKTKCDIIEILRKREQEHLMHLKDVINNISEGILVINDNHKITLCNNAVCNILGLKQIELLDYNNIVRKYSISTENKNDKSVDEYFNKHHMNNVPIKNLVLKLKDNNSNELKYIEYSSNPIIKSNGKLVYTIITLKDITDKKLNEIYAEEQSEFVKNVLNTLDLPISVLDYPGFTSRLLNKKFEQILNTLFDKEYSADNIIGKNILEVFSTHGNGEFIKKILYSVESNKELVLAPFSVKEANGKEKYYKMKITPYKVKDENKRIYVHGIDVTEEINHNLQLERINRMKDEFLTIISHELRTPLTIIYSSLQLANDIYSDEITPNIKKTLNRINQNCSRLLKLTNNIMDISKAEEKMLSINNKEFDVVMESEKIVNLVNLYGREKSLNIIFDTNEEECKVVIDKQKYERILLNLLSNAIKYTPENKHIYVLIDVKEDYFTLTIKDEGVGIPEDKIDCIFNRCTQIDSTLSRGAEGLGLGLTVVKKFMEAMEGSIYVKSKVAQGSEFIVVLDKKSPVPNSISQLTTISENCGDIVNIEMSDIN